MTGKQTPSDCITLTIHLTPEGPRWTAECVETGTSAFGKTVRQAYEAVCNLIPLHLNAMEDVGTRDLLFDRLMYRATRLAGKYSLKELLEKLDELREYVYALERTQVPGPSAQQGHLECGILERAVELKSSELGAKEPDDTDYRGTSDPPPDAPFTSAPSSSESPIDFSKPFGHIDPNNPPLVGTVFELSIPAGERDPVTSEFPPGGGARVYSLRFDLAKEPHVFFRDSKGGLVCTTLTHWNLSCIRYVARVSSASAGTPEKSSDALGRLVRETWIGWALQQPDPKPSWLVPYDHLSERDKEADRCIGKAVAETCRAEIAKGICEVCVLKAMKTPDQQQKK